MSARRLRVLIQHLPPESATWTALRNATSEEDLADMADKGEPEKSRWSQQEQLLASVLDAVRHLEWAFICANTDKKSKQPEPPKSTPRPGAKPLKPKAKLNRNAANMLADWLQLSAG